MSRFTVLVLAGLLITISASAAQRTFVSATGNDANPCSRNLPCRNFATAVAATAAGGEVVVLDSAGYGPVTLTQSVSLVAPTGVYAGITSFTGEAIAINATGTDTVVLRGLTLNSLGGNYGITANTVGSLHVESCVLSNFPGRGLNAQDALRIFVDDTVARGNYTAFGVFGGPTGEVAASFDRCRAENNTNGFGFQTSTNAVTAVVHECVAVTNMSAGFIADAGATLDVKSCVASYNSYGIYSQGTVSVSASIVSGNVAGLFVETGRTLESYGNNEVRGNGTDVSVGVTTVAPK